MKQTLLVLLAVTVLCSFTGCVMIPQGGMSKEPGLYFELNDDGSSYQVSRFIPKKTPETTVTIPDTHEGLPVTAVGLHAFMDAAALETVILPDTITHIGQGAFSGCAALKDIEIPEGVTTIGQYAFSQCTSLESIVIPDGVKELDIMLFVGCTNLKHVTVPKALEKIHADAFETCSSLTEISLPDTVYLLGSRAFAECTALQKVEFYETNLNVTVDTSSPFAIDEYAFMGCTALKEFTVPKRVYSVKWGSAFVKEPFASSAGAEMLDIDIKIHPDNPYFTEKDGILYSKDNTVILTCIDSKGITSLTIPEGVIEIQEGAFSGIETITSVTLPSTLQKLGVGSLTCALQSVRIPAGVMEGVERAFNLNVEFDVDSDNPNYMSIDGVLFDGNGYRLLQYPGARTEESYTVPDGVLFLEFNAFSGATGIKHVILPEGIKGIYGALNYCSIETVTIPATVETIYDSFVSCTNLKTILYGGTVGQWKAVDVGRDTGKNSGDVTVRCTDGNIPLISSDDA